MPLFPALRKRQPAQQISGANVRIRMGTFGSGGPAFGVVQVDPMASASIYNYHEGDLFAPGAGNFVFEPNFELPLVTIWGNAFIRRPNVFNPFQQPQVYANPTVVTNGLGGLSAGQIAFQPLIDPTQMEPIG